MMINLQLQNFNFYINKIQKLVQVAKKKDAELYTVRADYKQLVYLNENKLDAEVGRMKRDLLAKWNNPGQLLESNSFDFSSVDQQMALYERQVCHMVERIEAILNEMDMQMDVCVSMLNILTDEQKIALKQEIGIKQFERIIKQAAKSKKGPRPSLKNQLEDKSKQLWQDIEALKENF